MPTNPLDLTNHKISETYERVVQTSSNKLYNGLGVELLDLDGVIRTTSTYSDPSWLLSLAASKITQTTSYRFVTDAQITIWTGKQDAITLGTSAQYLKGDLTLGNISDLGGGGSTSVEQIDYVYDLTGDVDGNNTDFILTADFRPGTLKVYLDGFFQTKGVEYDYIESGTNKITFNLAPGVGSNISAVYTIA